MMDTDSTIEYMERVLAPAFCRKRGELFAKGLIASTNVPGGIVADRFSGNYSAMAKTLKAKFQACLNVYTLDEDTMVGGFSKFGKPCDKLHALWRVLCDACSYENR